MTPAIRVRVADLREEMFYCHLLVKVLNGLCPPQRAEITPYNIREGPIKEISKLDFVSATVNLVHQI